uniref:SFI1 centrin binding protein n=1 Tax=Ursus maritimus TaxID=29073 RepID=A0A452ULD5_URSMA
NICFYSILVLSNNEPHFSVRKQRFYYEQRILRKVFEEWKEEWWVFQREWKLCVRADCHYRVWWSQWRQQLGQVRVGHALLASAVKHRVLSLQQQAWSRWWEQFLHVQRERRKMVSAVKHCQHWQKWKSLKAWLEYLQVRRVKRQLNEMAERFHRVTVLQTRLCDWHWAWERKQSLYAQHARVEGLARRMALRRAFTHWRHYVLLCAKDAAQWKVAEEHRRRSLLHFCFRALKDNVTHAHLQQIRRNLAHQQHNVTLLHRFWGLWPSPWRLQSRADSHFQQRVLPAAFHAWRRFWRWHQQESVLSARAARFHRETLEKQVFAIWWQKMFQHRENRLAERMAILHSERQLLQRSWSTWHRQAAARHQERQCTAAAWAHHRHHQLRRAFCIWRDSARGLRREQTGLVLAAEFHWARLRHRAWDRWREVRLARKPPVRKPPTISPHWCHPYLSGLCSCRSVFRRWRENTLARVNEAKQTSQASAHYRRTLCSKVLVQWREVASVQIYYRQQEDCAIKEAQKVLDRGKRRSWQLGRGLGRTQNGLVFLLLPLCLCILLTREQGAQLLAQTRSRACFRQWKQQLVNRRREQQGTARALWFWSFSLQAKVWAAWLGFVLERRRKKARLEQAMQAYHRQLLQEGATRLLRFAASMKAFRQQLHAQQQVQAAHSLHRAVHRCAMLWKQKVLGQGREPRPPTSTVPSRRVTFDSPLSTCAGAGDAALGTKKPRGPHGPRGALGSLSLAAGDPQLQELNAARLARKQPRRPHFLLEPVPSQRPEAPRECDPGVAQPAGPALTRPSLPAAWTALVPSNPLPQPGALPSHPGPKLPPMLNTGPKLLPPSSFMPRGVEAPARASAQPTTPGLTPQASPSPAPVPHSRLLLPGDFTGPGPGSATTGHVDLEAELEGIQQQLQDYQTMKQNLS